MVLDKRVRRRVKVDRCCGICGKKGHNRRTCPGINQCDHCEKDLDYVTKIDDVGYKNNTYGCDLCEKNKKIDQGVWHCQNCEFDVCEECAASEKMKKSDL